MRKTVEFTVSMGIDELEDILCTIYTNQKDEFYSQNEELIEKLLLAHSKIEMENKISMFICKKKWGGCQFMSDNDIKRFCKDKINIMNKYYSELKEIDFRNSNKAFNQVFEDYEYNLNVDKIQRE